MKILFVNPPARRREYQSIVVPPLGLLHVATYLKQAGYDVRIKDAFAEGMDWTDFEKFIADEKPDILGLGGMTPVIDTTFRAIRIARPYVGWIVIGGPHVSQFQQEVFTQCPGIDYGVVGEGEETALALVNALQQGLSPEGMDGVITSRCCGGQRRTNPDIDTLPVPDRSLIPNRRYRYPLALHRPVTTLVTSRGCPFGCTFCDKSVFGSTWRGRSAEHVLAEIDDIFLGHGIRSLIFYDDLFTLKRERVIGICEGILQRGYRLDWKCEGRVNLVDPAVLRLMKKAGCSLIAYGVESASQAGLDYLDKRVTVEQIERAFALTAEAGIRTMAYFILGIPVEMYAEELKTIELAKRIRANYAQFSVLSPYRGTAIYDDAVRRGWYREVNAGNPFDKDLKRPVILSEHWDEAKMRRILKRAHREFYLRPGYMFKLALEKKSMHQWLDHLRELTHILSWMRS